ncbi:MAG TPA: sigma-70 family RNA polymerase sigma factor, partial [Planctomycetaceae bacterium]|nr:sigma-70 family RNA polymerase sigma factor [Planctomycetaceae bacterium]
AINAARDGDRSAFDTLLARFEGRLRILTKQMFRSFPGLRRWEETDDVFQAAMIRLHRSLADAHPNDARHFIGLCATQIRRTLLDLSRHYFGKLGPAAKHETSGGGRAADAPGGKLELAQRSSEPISIEDWTAFHEAIASLPEEQREVFELIWYTGLGQQEAADLLGLNRRTIVRRLQAARLQLTETLSRAS